MIDTKTAPYAALLLRLALGAMYLAHAGLKIFVFTPAGTVHFFASLGLPAVVAYADMAAEILGGLALLAGFYARWVALALVPILAGAVVLVHGANGWLFTNKGGGWEYPVFLIVASVALGLLGNGAYAWGGRSGSHAG